MTTPTMQTAGKENRETAEPVFNGKTAVVTGGARGLGKAIASRLSQSGAQIVIADIRRELAEETVSEMKEDGTDVFFEYVDVRNEESVQKALTGIRNKTGRIDFLINNAAIDRTVSIEELSVEEWDKVLETNLRGPFLMSKFVFPVMKQQGGGHIVNITSTAAKRAWANASAYHASKWGFLGFSHALHVEGREHGIKVSAVVAGGMKTPFLLDRFPDIDQNVLQDPGNVASTIDFLLKQPAETVIPEVMVIPARETSWP